ncbi:uncharacterized protein APUU_12388S [Aspergillus puulaauensis]|uniref:Uncharacterized protein n=1 Tax=Aspergillus puulaauensis TaxID=1220207 RepID=A0A7R7XE07_9EURO|nr:uncharacterized protein APUU_12388S [Aspergillus puulaauensis]BCS19560.1 hypothetical protein APUU_12388S [Aspergillus puulaauensis]
MDIHTRLADVRQMRINYQNLGLSDWSNIEPLFDKAINNPAEVTPEEKHKIAQWPSHEEMDAQCQKQFNRSIDDLLQAAATDRDPLNHPEARLIRQGFHGIDLLAYTEREAVARRRERFEKPLWDTYQKALASVLLPVELQAWNAVADSRWFNEKGASLQKQIHNPFVDSGPAPWVQRIIDQGDSKACGYAIYCSGLDRSEAWQNFQSYFDQRVSLVPSLGAGSDQIRSTKLTQFLNYEEPEDDLTFCDKSSETFETKAA